MSDNDDLDAFARLFGAEPETPPDGLLRSAEPWAAAPTAAPAPGSSADPLAWLLSDTPTAAYPADPFPPAAYPADPFPPAPTYPTAAPAYPPAAPAYSTAASPAAAYAAPTAAFPASFDPFAAAPAPATQVLPTRRSIAAEAARDARASSRRNFVILGGVGGVVLILAIVLVFVVIAKSGGSGSPVAAKADTDSRPSSSSSATPSATPTPSDTPTPTPTPTPTATQSTTVAPPPPSAPTVSATILTADQPNCASGGATTFTITYTSTNAATLTITSSIGFSNNITPEGSGTIPGVPYQCGSNATYTLTVHSSAEGVNPGVATVTPTP